MKLANTCTLPARPEVVWAALNDPAVLQACLPGCKSLEMTDARHFESIMQIRVGPIAATFKSNVELSDLVPPKAYTITGQGTAGPVGFAKVTARVQLEPQGDATLLQYDADVDIGGKLMTVGARLIQSAANTNLQSFFDALKAQIERISGLEPEMAVTPDESKAARSSGSVREREEGAASMDPIAARPQKSVKPANARWPVWLLCASTGVVGLLIGFFVGHVG
jgi:carbon monoxide dehydrogenase subunit G